MNQIEFNFPFFRRIGSDSFLFFVESENKNCFRSDPMATLHKKFPYDKNENKNRNHFQNKNKKKITEAIKKNIVFKNDSQSRRLRTRM